MAVDFAYLYKGICGLARSPRASVFAGHLGAAVIAGYFVGEDQSDLPDGVYRGIEGELDRIIRGEETIWFNAKKAGITPHELFDPYPKQSSDRKLIDSIAKALAKNIDRTRQSGHNVIFASIGIRALSDHPQYATPEIVAGISKLIAGFDNAVPGRGYLGKEKGWVEGKDARAAESTQFAPYRSLGDMAETVLKTLIESTSVRRRGFGGLWHIINHAAGLVELDHFGYKQLALSGLPAHHEHIRLWRSLPDVSSELGLLPKAAHDPRTPAYWHDPLKRDDARLTHRIKTLYGYFILRRFIADREDMLRRADEAFLHLMA